MLKTLIRSILVSIVLVASVSTPVLAIQTDCWTFCTMMFGGDTNNYWACLYGCL